MSEHFTPAQRRAVAEALMRVNAKRAESGAYSIVDAAADAAATEAILWEAGFTVQDLPWSKTHCGARGMACGCVDDSCRHGCRLPKGHGGVHDFLRCRCSYIDKDGNQHDCILEGGHARSHTSGSLMW